MKTFHIFVFPVCAACLFSGCTKTESGFGGAALGTAAGAGIGYAIDGGAGGAILGGVLGGLGGAALGTHLGEDEEPAPKRKSSRSSYSEAPDTSIRQQVRQEQYMLDQEKIDWRKQELEAKRLEIERKKLELQEKELEQKRIELELAKRK